jgi:hypothetical protein
MIWLGVFAGSGSQQVSLGRLWSEDHVSCNDASHQSKVFVSDGTFTHRSLVLEYRLTLISASHWTGQTCVQLYSPPRWSQRQHHR